MIRQQGLEQINLDQLVENMLPQGRALVSTDLKENLLRKIKDKLEQDEDYRRLTGYNWMRCDWVNIGALTRRFPKGSDKEDIEQ